MESGDDQIIEVAGGVAEVDISLTNYYGFSNNPNITFNDTTLELESASFTTTSDDLGGMVFWDQVDGSGFSTRIASAGSVICLSERFKSVSCQYIDTVLPTYQDRALDYAILPIITPIDTINKINGTIETAPFGFRVKKTNAKIDSGIPSRYITLSGIHDKDGIVQIVEATQSVYGLAIVATPNGGEGVTIGNYSIKFFDDTTSITYPRIIV